MFTIQMYHLFCVDVDVHTVWATFNRRCQKNASEVHVAYSVSKMASNKNSKPAIANHLHEILVGKCFASLSRWIYRLTYSPLQ